jgi:hypothetical protein
MITIAIRPLSMQISYKALSARTMHSSETPCGPLYNGYFVNVRVS